MSCKQISPTITKSGISHSSEYPAALVNTHQSAMIIATTVTLSSSLNFFISNPPLFIHHNADNVFSNSQQIVARNAYIIHMTVFHGNKYPLFAVVFAVSRIVNIIVGGVEQEVELFFLQIRLYSFKHSLKLNVEIFP